MKSPGEISDIGVKSVNKALILLEKLATAPEGLSLSDLDRTMSFHKSTIHRLLQSLKTYRFVTQNPETKKYQLGLKLFELSHSAVENRPFIKQTRPQLERLREETNETIHLGVLDAGEVVYVDKLESQRVIKMHSSIGKRSPAHCTGLGKAIIAYLPRADLRSIKEQHGLRRFTERTITSFHSLLEELQEVRSKGYAIDNAEHEEEVRCIAAPIFDHLSQQQAIAAISITVPSFRMTTADLEDYIPVIKKRASKISSSLGSVEI